MADWKPPVFEGEIKNYTPTLRDRITYGISGLMSGRGELGPDRESMTRARMIANALEYTPLGLATAADDVARATGRGDYAGAGLGVAMAGLPIPAKRQAAKVTGEAAKKTLNSIMQKHGLVDQPVREISSLEDVKGLAKTAGEDKIFVRWSAGPKYDMAPNANSRDYQAGNYHEGLSAVPLMSETDGNIFKSVRDYSYLRGEKYPNNAPHFYLGKVVGKDTDGAPTIRPTKYLGSGSPKLVSYIDDDANLELLEAQEQVIRLGGIVDYYSKNPPIPYGMGDIGQKYDTAKKTLNSLLEKRGLAEKKTANGGGW